MNTPADNQSFVEFPQRGELRIVRLLPGPIERIWAYLTDPEKRARWICGGATEPRAGGKVEFVMHHAKLSPHETPPAHYAQVHEPGVTFEGRVLRYEPPHVLSFTFGADNSQVTFELAAEGDQVRLELTHRSTGDDIPEQKNYASGWHIHLDFLLAVLEEQPTPKLWEMHTRLSKHYEQLAPR